MYYTDISRRINIVPHSLVCKYELNTHCAENGGIFIAYMYLNAADVDVYTGQQVVEEVLDAQRPGCPPEYFNIKIPKGHEQYDKDNEGDIELPLLRSRYDMNTGYSPNVPRQQVRAG